VKSQLLHALYGVEVFVLIDFNYVVTCLHFSVNCRIYFPRLSFNFYHLKADLVIKTLKIGLRFEINMLQLGWVSNFITSFFKIQQNQTT